EGRGGAAGSPEATQKPRGGVGKTEAQALGGRVVTRTEGLVKMGAHWIIAFFQFVFARPPAENAPAGALGRRMDHALTGELRTGLRVLIVAAVIAGGWGTFVPLGGAIVAPGVIVVESKIKKVQHPSGGIISQINVKDGSH